MVVQLIFQKEKEVKLLPFLENIMVQQIYSKLKDTQIIVEEVFSIWQSAAETVGTKYKYKLSMISKTKYKSKQHHV